MNGIIRDLLESLYDHPMGQGHLQYLFIRTQYAHLGPLHS